MKHSMRYSRVGESTARIKRAGWLSFLLILLIACPWFPTKQVMADEDPTGWSVSDSGNSKGVGQQDITLPELSEVENYCKAYYCYDRTTKQVLLSYNEDIRVYPASMTKILTLPLAMEYLEPHEEITVSKTAMDATTPNSTMMGLVVGETLEVNEVYYGLMLPSGNDAANVLAEEIAKHYANTKGALPTTTPNPTPPTDGSPITQDPNTFSLIGQFAYIANMKIRELGLTDSHFVNPNGLQNENHYTTAHDLTMMFDYALGFEDFCTVIHTPTHAFKADNKHDFDGWKIVRNTNYLLQDPWIIGADSHCAEVFGGKTGTTKTAGTGMTLLTINENGHEIITCVCGISYDVSDHQTVYVASVVRAANIECWNADPVKRVEGNVTDHRSYNAPDWAKPEGDQSCATVPGTEEQTETSSTMSTSSVSNPANSEPSEQQRTQVPKLEEKTLFESHPFIVIALVALTLIVIVFVIVTIVSVGRARRRKRKMGIRKINF